MKKICINILFCFICGINSYGQINFNKSGGIVFEIIKEKKTHEFICTVEIKSFTGIDSSSVKFLVDKLTELVRTNKRISKGKYTIPVRFLVAKDGTVADILCENDDHPLLCQVVLKELKRSQSFRIPVKVMPLRKSVITSSPEPTQN